MKKISAFALVVPFFASCSARQNSDFDVSSTKDTNGFNILVEQLSCNIESLWGLKEILIAGPKDYVRYTDAYQTRSHINFDEGLVIIETIVDNNPASRLRLAIVQTLLMEDNPGKINLYSRTNDIISSKEPFLYGQVLDHTSQPIRWKEEAIRFANYLLKYHLKSRHNGDKIIYSVSINLVPHHLDKRAHKYLNMIRQASYKYGIDESLILAIIQTESSFNPYAVSRSNALGLMQVIRHSAGRDVFRIQGKNGIPSRGYLFKPYNNIDTGVAYLALLNNVYLSGIENPISRRYAVITAYHGGAGSVLRLFSEDKVEAENIINSLPPRDVYAILTTCHPSIESRYYLCKVNTAQKKYKRGLCFF